MKEEYNIKGTYTVNNGEEKEFEIWYEINTINGENHNKLLELAKDPFKLVLEGAKYGITAYKRPILLLLLAFLSGAIVFFFGMYKFFVVGAELVNLLYILVNIAASSILIGFMLFSAYNFLILDVMRVINKNLNPLYKKLCSILIEKIALLIEGENVDLNKDLKTTVNIALIIDEYFQKIPKLIRKGVTLLLKRVPLIGMLTELKAEILNDKEKASTLLFTEIDSFINESIFGNLKSAWTMQWLKTITITFIIQILIIITRIG